MRNIFLFAIFFLYFSSFLFYNSLAQQPKSLVSDVIQADLSNEAIDAKIYKSNKNDDNKNITNSADKKNEKSQLVNSKLESNFAKTNDLASTLLGNAKISSLMFDEEEIFNINRAIESFKNNETFSIEQNIKDSKDTNSKKIKDVKVEDENEKSYIYLASIIYYSPKNWAVWINNSKITFETNQNTKELFVKQIYHDQARIIWSLSISKWKILSGKNFDDYNPKLNNRNNVEIEFVLKPNQTFILGSNRVVEGRAVVNMTKEKDLAKKKEKEQKNETLKK